MAINSNSDWASTIKPVASKLYQDLLKTHSEDTAAVIEALEIARRQAEINATINIWRARHGFDSSAGGNLLTEAATVYKTVSDEFGPQRAVHILTAIEREHSRCQWGNELRLWRQYGGKSVEQAAVELGLSIEDVQAIEGGTLSAGPEAMRLIRPALRLVRHQNQAMRAPEHAHLDLP